jgi:type IV secretion system protein TrbL
MNFADASVINQFMDTFIRYIDSGFGLLGGNVAHLTAIMIGIDITLAGLMWALDTNGNAIAKFIKKILYVGTFAFILNNFSYLADIIFNSFSGLGLSVTNNSLTPADLLQPGTLASTGFKAAWPLLDQASSMLGFTSFFDNFVTVIVLLVAWLIVVVAFFVLAVQLFITVLEFKLTTLAGFVLVPFALWNKSSFLAERVLGNVISSGIKVMVLAVIVGIGASFFSDFINALNGQEPNLAQAMSLVLASITLFGIGIFGPGIAAGLVSGAPQLGAGAAIGTAGGLAAGAALGGAAAAGGARLIGSAGVGAVRAGTSLGSGAATSYRLGQQTSGESGMAGVGAGLAGVAKAGAGAIGQRLLTAAQSASSTLREDAQSGAEGAWAATGGKSGKPTAEGKTSSAANQNAPSWARDLPRTIRNEQRNRARAHTAAQTIKDGDKGGGAANPDLSEEKA